MNSSIDESMLLRYFAKTMSEEEKEEVECWLKLSDENRKMAQQVGHIYFACQLVQTNKEVDVQQEWLTVQAKVNRRRTFTMWKKWGSAAAILLLPLMAFFVFMRTEETSKVPVPEQLVEVRVEVGATNSVLLPDSSVVFLNSGAYLKYPVHFVQNRSVYLQGEAYFVVKKSRNKRFIVHTPAGAKVEVLGTEFNMQSEAAYVSTTLAEGSVKFVCHNKANQEEEIRIVPGERIRYDLDTRMTGVEKVNVDEIIDWKDGSVVFKDCSLMNVLNKLSKRYQAAFIVKNEALKEQRFTGSFKDLSLEQILENFTLSTKMKYKYINQKSASPDGSDKITIELY